MAKKHIVSVSHDYNVPREEVFAVIADPYKLGEINSFNIERIKDSTGDDVNGVGSVKRLKMGFFSKIDEVVTEFDVPELIEYRVLTGIPVKNHVGRMTFVDLGNGRSRVEFLIHFESKYPGFGGMLRLGLEQAVKASVINIENYLK